MNCLNNDETHVKMLTDVCQNVCTYIKAITLDNNSKDEKIINFETKFVDLQCLCSDLKSQLEHVNEQVKTLATLMNFTSNQDDSAISILTQWILSLSKKNVDHNKKRKLYSSYSPLKLSLKDKTAVNENIENKLQSMIFEMNNKTSSQNELKNVWKLQVKRDGKPSDLLKKSKQTTLNTIFQPQKENVKMDITTLGNSTPKLSDVNSTTIFSPEILNIQNDVSSHINNSISITQMNDSGNISLSHFNKIIKPNKNALPIVKTNTFNSNNLNTSLDENEQHNYSSDNTSCSPTNISINILNDAIKSKKQNKIPDRNLINSFDIIPGLNDSQNDQPNYKFKEDPVRKRNERKMLNGWDCEDCCKFYEANNDNPVDAKIAMNHFSRHRSVKHQHHAPTPPDFWNPM